MNSSMVKTQGIGDSARTGCGQPRSSTSSCATGTGSTRRRYGTTNTSDYYLSFEALNSTDTETCYQWRVHTGGLLQQRTGSSANTGSVTTTSPAFSTVAIGVANPTNVLPFTVSVLNPNQVLVDLILQSSGRPVGHAETKLTITARNIASGPGSTKCNVTNP